MSLDMDSGKRVRENRKENSQKKKKKGKERDTSVTRDSHPLHPLCAGRVFFFLFFLFYFFRFYPFRDGGQPFASQPTRLAETGEFSRLHMRTGTAVKSRSAAPQLQRTHTESSAYD